MVESVDIEAIDQRNIISLRSPKGGCNLTSADF